MSSRVLKFKIEKGKQGYYFKIIAKNGKILCHSEQYQRITGAKTAIKAIIQAVAINDMEVQF